MCACVHMCMLYECMHVGACVCLCVLVYVYVYVWLCMYKRAYV